MRIRDYVIYSHLTPPRNQQGVLSRPRVTQTILDNISYPLLILQAGTGYGKSTELVTLTKSLKNYFGIAYRNRIAIHSYSWQNYSAHLEKVKERLANMF